jgi:hypothetical protein
MRNLATAAPVEAAPVAAEFSFVLELAGARYVAGAAVCPPPPRAGPIRPRTSRRCG